MKHVHPKPDQVLIFTKVGINDLVLCEKVTWGARMHTLMKFNGSHNTFSIP